jgi:AbrB family looped-hinge helix DNA binding protein
MNDERQRFKVLGSMVVSPRGQVVIPACARKELDIHSGDTLLVCGTPQGDGLMLLKVDVMERILSAMTEDLASISRLMHDYRGGTSRGSETES